MANRHRGAISATINGQQHTLCLTLGALAELETALGVQDMMALAQRFETGRLAAQDIIAILAAGLRGGGLDIRNEDVARFALTEGIAFYIQLVARLLNATFGEAEAETPANP